jgi:hypothetical protein
MEKGESIRTASRSYTLSMTSEMFNYAESVELPVAA